MKIHEYQARDLLAQAGVPVPNGVVVEAAEQAERYEKIGGGRVVVKAQVYAGGRGKAGYVKLCDSAEQVEEACRFMFGKPMVSVQTGPAGVTGPQDPDRPGGRDRPRVLPRRRPGPDEARARS